MNKGRSLERYTCDMLSYHTVVKTAWLSSNQAMAREHDCSRINLFPLAGHTAKNQISCSSPLAQSATSESTSEDRVELLGHAYTSLLSLRPPQPAVLTCKEKSAKAARNRSRNHDCDKGASVDTGAGVKGIQSTTQERYENRGP